jgi:hypothetical protein
MNHKRILAIAGMGFLLLTISTLLVGNETIFPSALVLLLLCLIGWISPTPSASNAQNVSTSEKAARTAIISFTIFVAVLSILVSLFLPGIAVTYGMTGLFDGDFVRVSINDAHELAYTTCLLLVLDLIFLAGYRRKQNWTLRPGERTGLNKPA